jgi:putative ABC transport system permease protein
VVLRTRFHARPGQPDNFDVLTPDAIRGFIDQVLGMIAAIVVPVTLISLVVGGIVIMNIMLVSVTERTREIGVRKAIGAPRGAIVWQFLVESATLSVIGGTIGMALGFLIAALVSAFSVLPYVVNAAIVVIALLVTIAIGLVFGTYPAVRAARLDPVEALRSE